MVKKKQRKEPIETDTNFAKDVEKATEPIMDRARQIKAEVNEAAGEIKNVINVKHELMRNKTEKLMEAGDKFATETRNILGAEVGQPDDFRQRYGLRGKKLIGLIFGIVILAILALFGKGK